MADPIELEAVAVLRYVEPLVPSETRRQTIRQHDDYNAPFGEDAPACLQEAQRVCIDTFFHDDGGIERKNAQVIPYLDTTAITEYLDGITPSEITREDDREGDDEEGDEYYTNPV